jgi:hypothetical protein
MLSRNWGECECSYDSSAKLMEQILVQSEGLNAFRLQNSSQAALRLFCSGILPQGKRKKLTFLFVFSWLSLLQPYTGQYTIQYTGLWPSVLYCGWLRVVVSLIFSSRLSVASTFSCYVSFLVAQETLSIAKFALLWVMFTPTPTTFGLWPWLVSLSLVVHTV